MNEERSSNSEIPVKQFLLSIQLKVKVDQAKHSTKDFILMYNTNITKIP